MNLDEEEPPSLVNINAEEDVLIVEEVAALKVPITIVTGINFHHKIALHTC